MSSMSPDTSATMGTNGLRSLRIATPTVGLALGAVLLTGVGVMALESSGGVWSGLAAGRAVLLAPSLFALVATLLAAERCRPAERRPLAARGHLHDGAFFVVHILAVVPFMTLLSVAFARLLHDGLPWAALSWTSRMPTWLLAVATFVLMDGANWAAHWADHRIAALWRVHALHHSQEELSVLTSFRAHPLSHLPGFMLAAIPPFVLFGPRGVAPALISLYVCLGTVPHANLTWSYGPVGRIMVSPAYHRRHHAVDNEAGMNLGIVLTVWDTLAKRASFPEKGRQPPPTGLADRAVPVEQVEGARWHPDILLRQLAEPFLARPE
jgi:sterol desaturase/sphingolipid hydroxylase (fatty acid hydroxylase superfamily)